MPQQVLSRRTPAESREHERRGVILGYIEQLARDVETSARREKVPDSFVLHLRLRYCVAEERQDATRRLLDALSARGITVRKCRRLGARLTLVVQKAGAAPKKPAAE